LQFDLYYLLTLINGEILRDPANNSPDNIVQEGFLLAICN